MCILFPIKCSWSRPYVVAFIKCDVMSVASECVRVSLFTRVLFYVFPTWLLLDRGPKWVCDLQGKTITWLLASAHLSWWAILAKRQFAGILEIPNSFLFQIQIHLFFPINGRASYSLCCRGVLVLGNYIFESFFGFWDFHAADTMCQHGGHHVHGSLFFP